MAAQRFLRLPDELVGSSSMMPQKRNAFLLEHVQGRSAAALGGLVAASTAMHSTPFSNSIAVGTEGTKPVWAALRATTDALTLLRLVIAAADPVPERMLERAREGVTTATALAEQMVAAGVPFRTAHTRIGAAIREAEEQERPVEEALSDRFAAPFEPLVDPDTVARRLEYGGGPGEASEAVAALRSDWLAQAERARAIRARWREARVRLAATRRAVSSDRLEL